MGGFMAQKPVYPDFPDIGIRISELGRYRVPEGMEGDFRW
jgi:hypothetical protein